MTEDTKKTNKNGLKINEVKNYYENITLDFFNEMFNNEVFNYLDNELNIKNFKDDEFKCEYDLDYAQGSHFRFNYLSVDIMKAILKSQGFKNNKKYTIDISRFEKNSNQYRKHNFDIEFEKSGNFVEDEETEQEIRDLIFNKIEEMEHSLFSQGQNSLEYQEKEEQCREAFRDFLKFNNIESDEDYFAYAYSFEKTDKYTQVWNGEYCELWVLLPKLEEKTKEIKYYEFI